MHDSLFYASGLLFQDEADKRVVGAVNSKKSRADAQLFLFTS